MVLDVRAVLYSTIDSGVGTPITSEKWAIKKPNGCYLTRNNQCEPIIFFISKLEAERYIEMLEPDLILGGAL
jgi:hypothetical protein